MIKHIRLINIIVLTFISLTLLTGFIGVTNWNAIKADSGELGKGCKDNDKCNSGLTCMRKFGYDRDVCVQLRTSDGGFGCGSENEGCCTIYRPKDISVPSFCWGSFVCVDNTCIDESTPEQDEEDEDNQENDENNQIDYRNGVENCNLQDDPGCVSCIGQGGIWTAIGCIDPSPTGILTGLIRIGYGVMGGVALLQLIFVGLMYQSGDEAKIADARSKLFATLGGVALLTFSVLILRIIGINILDVIPVGGI